MTDKSITLMGYDAEKVQELMQFALPEAALKKHPTKSYLTTIDPDFTRERLTKIFGLYGVGWGLEWDVNETMRWEGTTSTGKSRWHFAILKATFWFRFGEEAVSFSVTGHSDNDNLGDAMAGARTRCISDAAKQMLFQLHIYKNVPYQSPNQTQDNQPAPKAKAQPVKPNGDQPKGQPDRNYLDDLFDEVQGRTNNYYDHKAHLYNALGGWPKQDDKEAISQAVETAVKHVAAKLDDQAAKESQ